MFTVKRFKFVSRQTLFNPIEFFAVVFLFSRHARSSSSSFFFPPSLLAFQLFFLLSRSLFLSPARALFSLFFLFFRFFFFFVFFSFYLFTQQQQRSAVKSDEKHFPQDDSITESIYDRSVSGWPRLCDWTVAWEPLFPDVSDCIMDDYYAHPCKFRQKRSFVQRASRCSAYAQHTNRRIYFGLITRCPGRCKIVIIRCV